MKSFTQFITEAKEIHDMEGLGSGTGLSHRGGDKIGSERKLTTPEKRRVKAIGGGKTALAKAYKRRKDAGEQRPTGRATEREQQPTRERGSAALSAREAQRKAAQERRAAKSGGKSKADLEKAASELLAKKPKATVDPKYKPRKASGLTHRERLNLVKKGEKKLRDLRLQNLGKKKESELKNPVTQKETTRRRKKEQQK